MTSLAFLSPVALAHARRSPDCETMVLWNGFGTGWSRVRTGSDGTGRPIRAASQACSLGRPGNVAEGYEVEVVELLTGRLQEEGYEVTAKFDGASGLAEAKRALLRQWAGHDAAIAQREAEIQRLERLVWDAIYALQKAGLDTEAAELRRAITGQWLTLRDDRYPRSDCHQTVTKDRSAGSISDHSSASAPGA